MMVLLMLGLALVVGMAEECVRLGCFGIGCEDVAEENLAGWLARWCQTFRMPLLVVPMERLAKSEVHMHYCDHQV